LGAASRRDSPAGTSSPGLSIKDFSPQPAGNGRLLWEETGFSGLRVIGQLRDTYIICEGREGLILIDQHAAHERVVYDQLTKSAESGKRAAQVLLVPETVDLGYRESRALEGIMPYLKELGIEIEPFGGNTVIVKAVPGVLSGKPVRPFITEMAEAAAGGALRPGEALDRCRQLAACHGAIRAHQRLTVEQMHQLLRQLDACANLSHCPHGRPTWLRYGMGEIERGFRRVV
jgi:DNA mismatch repair protein MutL